MGWDTRIILLAEGVGDVGITIARQVWQQDAHSYVTLAEPAVCYQKPDVLFFSYERRKYAPYWVVEPLSAAYPEVRFTLLGDMLDFLGGPAGLIQLQNGLIQDSYGFFDHRQEAITNAHPEQILGWFGQNGPETALRARHLAELPPKWCEGDYVSRLIPDEAPARFMTFIEPLVDPPDKYGWTEVEPTIFTTEDL